ncbi:uncharacterized protein IL334_001824 [Kwoniella shivajii]|uniref:Pre-rRNA-processing protein RIX1 n=1 Tax=Kwoniella shivajii TaxID=564305 RepID=A0ABZ1CTM9_9TREE|nr:hypothetical protein IL334_001824 [Kwoniella shivajii]
MSSALLSLLNSLSFSHASFLPLLESHKPFSNPSSLPQSTLHKLLNRLNSTLLSREDNPERRAACDIAREVVSMDEEGYVMTSFGKGWVGTCLGYIAAPSSPVTNTPSYLSLLTTIVTSSSQYPSFEREVVLPVMGKISVSLGKLFERCLIDSHPEWDIVLDLLSTLRVLLLHSPAAFRPLLPTLKPSLYNLVLQIPTPSRPYPSTPSEIRRLASDLIASLHVTAGKAQSPQSWGIEIKEDLGGFGRAMSAITVDAWEEEPVKAQPPTASSALPELPIDPMSRLPVALDWIEGFSEAILALLRFPTARPVPVPMAQIVSAGLRCVSLTLDTPTVSYISPQHHAALLACLPRIWTVGVQLIGSVAIACGDHLFPHLGSILDHTVWLAERVPSTMVDTQIQLLKFHNLFLTLYPPAIVPVEFPTRLLRLCLTKLQPLLENKSRSNDSSSAQVGGGKRGKKRARGAEDGLVGGLEGREGKSIGQREGEIIVHALKLTPLLHATPLFSPSLLTFSIRLHLSLYLSLSSLSGIFTSSASSAQIRDTLHDVLEKAVLMTEGEGGTARGWKSLIISVLDHRSEIIAPILHPSLPPLMRPMPPLSQLHFFVKEGEEERKERIAMGFGQDEDNDHLENDEDEDGNDVVMKQPNSQLSSNNVRGTQTVNQHSTVDASSATGSATASTLPVNVVQSTSTTQTIEKLSQPLIPTISTPDDSSNAPPVGGQPAPVVPLAEPTSPVAAVESFISFSKTTTKTVEKEGNTEDVIMLQDEDDEALPELDSGSDDFDEDEDEEDDDEEE